MRDPSSIIQVPYNGDEYTVLPINEVPEFDLQDYDLQDEKDFKNYIKSIERICRTSYEYRQMVNFLRENLDMNKCSFYKNVNNIDSFKIKIHIHHEPITLYEICQIVYNKRSFYKESLSEDMISKEVMFLHYKLMVGLIPLAETVHELVHNQYLFIPTSKVMGKYREFVNMYQEFFLPEQLDTLERIEKATLDYDYNQATAVLERNYVYLDLSGSYTLPRYEDVINMMDKRIKEIKSEKKLIKPVYHVQK